MKSRILLVYGYILPFVASGVTSLLPRLLGYDYRNIVIFFSNNPELPFAVLAVFIALTYPFQTTIINEDNPHVLAVLENTNVREVFKRASIFQAIFIILASLLIIFLSANSVQSSLSGYFIFLAFALTTFESIALISNGRAYGSIREKIITAVNKEELKKSLLQQQPNSGSKRQQPRP